MNLLLDTHSFLWFIAGSDRLSRTARALIEEPVNQPFLSIASAWEMAIKLSLGKLAMTEPFDALLSSQLATNGIELLDIKLPHVTVVAELPFHHRDPFDRLLIGQAQVEGIPIVSEDAIFDTYGVTRLW